MKITKIIVPPLDVNCYIVEDENSHNCILFDVGGGYEEVINIAKDRKLTPVAAIFTHGHFDHVLDGEKVKMSGIKVYMTEKDEKLFDGRGDLARYCGVKFTPFKPDFYLEEKDYNICGIKFSTIFTPGHTAGSCCFLFDNFILSGDTLFKGNFGRYDFPTGSLSELKGSIKNKIFNLSDNLIVYPGHGEHTVLGWEKEHNAINEY